MADVSDNFFKEAEQRNGDASVIELRSDTLTKPDWQMRRAMGGAHVGDAVWRTDKSVIDLEKRVADLCGKEAALFVPSGTMGNLVCVMCHCDDGRSSEVIVGDKAHQLLNEAGNLASIGGIQTRSVPTNPDGTLSLDAIRAALRGQDQHFPSTRAVLLENTHNFCGGKVLPMDYVRQVRALIDAHPINKVALHCDGARIWHAAIALNTPVKELLEPFDTCSLCFSKGLGAPAGSVIVGSRDLIEGKARRYVKMLGGMMRQVGVLAAACDYALTYQYYRLAEDHTDARALYEALKAKGIDAMEPQTNILIWAAPAPGTARRVVELCAAKNVLVSAINDTQIRAIPHYGSGFDVETVVTVVLEAHAKVLGAQN
jgi:threonine aldolase